jgi:energy-coupling factor transporter transmembrane protein EcfT
MAHIHLGDGSFPLWALVLWTTLGVALVGAAVYRIGRGGNRTHEIALLICRFTFVMIGSLEHLATAALSRGTNFSEFRSNKRLYSRILGMTMLSAIEQSE